MIFTERTIRIINGLCEIDNPILLYRGDFNVEIRFTIIDCPYKYTTKDASNVIEITNASYGQLVIKTPTGDPIFSDVTATNEGAIVFTITGDMIDETIELGEYDFQIRLFDAERTSRATICPVVGGIKIEEPIAIEGGSTVVADSNEVNVARTNYAVTTTAAPLEVFDSQGNYIETTWTDKMLITDARLNKIEDGITGVNQKIANIDLSGVDLTGYAKTEDIPTNVSQLTNDANYTTKTYVDNAIGNIDASNMTITDTANNFTATNVEGALQEVGSRIKDIVNNFTLTIGLDGLLYISDGKGNLLGNGIDIGNAVVIDKDEIVFNANFSNTNLSSEQFTTWDGRIYDSSIYEIGTCTDNQLHLTSIYDSENSRWIKQMCHTAGLFESDNFTCEFKAKFDGTAGSWNNVITYGTGTYWTSGLYSDGVKWPAGGEIDAFEQAAGYAENPNYFRTPIVHYGAGSESGYPNTHEITRGFASDTVFTTNEWHIFKFTLKNGVVEIYIDDEKKQEYDFSTCTVNNNYLCEYTPFLKPQAFYLDGSCSSSSDTSNTYDFVIDYFKIYQDEKVDATALNIFPQMWSEGTNLIFPTDAEMFLDKEFTPANTSNKACTWTSSNPSVATVVQGYVKTLAEGTTEITATNGNISSTYNLTVNNTTANIPCSKIIINSENINLFQGNTTAISVYKYPNFTTDTVVFTSDNRSIATIDETSGLITATGAGTCNIIATCGNQTSTISVTVVVNNNEPVIKYDMTAITSAISERWATWSSDKTGGTIATIANIGTLGSVANSTLSVKNTSEQMSPDLMPQSDTIAVSKTDTWLWVIKNWMPDTYNEQLSLNSTGTNKMPSIQSAGSSLKIRYGHADLYTTTGIPTTIVIGHDTAGYYLYIDGEIVATRGSETTTDYLENIYGLKYNTLGIVSTDEKKTSICNKIEAIQTAVYLADRNSIQTILDKDFI